jgi:hypothetical protein
VSLPVSQIFAITVTANHFFLDAVAGGIVAMGGLAIAYALQRWGYPWLQDQLRRLPWPTLRDWLLGYAGPA